VNYRIIYQNGSEDFLENTTLEPIELLLSNPNIIQIYVYDEFGIQIEFFEQL